jgi:hypothetical protein
MTLGLAWLGYSLLTWEGLVMLPIAVVITGTALAFPDWIARNAQMFTPARVERRAVGPLMIIGGLAICLLGALLAKSHASLFFAFGMPITAIGLVLRFIDRFR